MREPRRTWGFWTRAKLEILAHYLAAFASASKRAAERIYLDAFAGEGVGTDRLTGEQFEGSARVALGVQNPPFTRLRFFEVQPLTRDLQSRLEQQYPDRDIRVYAGDCNVTIPKALADLQEVRWAPTFAFLDPDGMEVAWKTLVALADHKRGYRGPHPTKPEYKVEMWILFPSQGLIRTLQLKTEPSSMDAARATRLFGDESWRAIHALRRAGRSDGAEAREHFVNLMRWRLERALGYQWSSIWVWM